MLSFPLSLLSPSLSPLLSSDRQDLLTWIAILILSFHWEHAMWVGSIYPVHAGIENVREKADVAWSTYQNDSLVVRDEINNTDDVTKALIVIADAASDPAWIFAEFKSGGVLSSNAPVRLTLCEVHEYCLWRSSMIQIWPGGWTYDVDKFLT